MQREKHIGSILAGFAAGALTTILIGGYALFGPQGRRNRKRAEAWILRAKAEILERMMDAQDLTEEQYYRIVDAVLDAYDLAGQIGGDAATRISDRFKARWNEMREAAREASERARRELDEEDTEIL